MNVANANELRGVRGACRVPCACTATTVHVHGTEAQHTTPIKVCQEQNNTKQLARDWREIFAVRKIADGKISVLSYSNDRDEICLGEGWRIVEYVCAHAVILRKRSA
jgi:hypothetical protein